MQNYIVAARTAQGYEDWHKSTREERLDVVSRWQAIQVELEKEKNHVRHGSFHGHHCYLKTSVDEKKKIAKEEKKKRKRSTQGQDTAQVSEEIPASHPFIDRPQRSNGSENAPDSAEFEEAIQTSVAATSRGNPEEDRLIERAIRASVVELQLAAEDGDDEDAVQRAIQASVAEAARARGKEGSSSSSNFLDGAGDHDKELEAALYRSVQDLPPHSGEQHTLVGTDFDDSGVDTDDDENIKAAIERSNSALAGESMAPSPKDDEMQRAIELSKMAHEEHEQDQSKSKTEEEIVLEYIKKQSLAEEQHKHSLKSRETQTGSDFDSSDRDLEHAMQASLGLRSKEDEISRSQSVEN